jgi:hypothetical protein
MSSRLKSCCTADRPALSGIGCAALAARRPNGQLGRSQAVRQRILIPPFGGSIPPAPASHSCFQRISFFWRDRAAKCGLFLSSNVSGDGCSHFFGRKNPESLQPNPGKLPFSGDSPWRPENKSTARQGWQQFLVAAHRPIDTFPFLGRSTHNTLPRATNVPF